MRATTSQDPAEEVGVYWNYAYAATAYAACNLLSVLRKRCNWTQKLLGGPSRLLACRTCQAEGTCWH